MEGLNQPDKQSRKLIANWKRLVVALAVGVPLIAISFVLNWWWVAVIVLLLTLFLACFALAPDRRVLVLTAWAMLAVALVVGSLVDEYLPLRWGPSAAVRGLVPFLVGIAAGLVIVVVPWLAVLAVTTQWVLGLADGLGVSWGHALRSVARRVLFGSKVYLVVENGKLVVGRQDGDLPRVWWPRILEVKPGNAVVLERGGKVTRIVGPGVYRLERYEAIKRPEDTKGIVDLRPQGIRELAERVLTKDGIALDIAVSVGFQIEPKEVTDKRLSAETGAVIEGDYPVYEATVRKAVFGTGDKGWQGPAVGRPISILRDVIGAYSLDEIIVPTENPQRDPDARAISEVERIVNARCDLSGLGVHFRGLDIAEIGMPDDVYARMVKRWSAPVEADIRVQEADGERRAMIQIGEGRAASLERLEGVRLVVRARMIKVIQDLVGTLPQMDQEKAVLGFISVIQELTNRVGQDETVAMRYIEAMQSIVKSEGPKSFIITPPSTTLSMLPSPPAPIHPDKPQTKTSEGEQA